MLERIGVGYEIHTIDGVDVAEPASGCGPAFAQDPETGWWCYLYDVAVGTCVGGEVAVC